MRRVPALTDAQKAVIIQLVQDDKIISEISRRIGRSRKAIMSFLKPVIEDGDRKKVGRPSQISATERRTVIWTARRGLIPASHLVSMYRLNVGVRRIQLILA